MTTRPRQVAKKFCPKAKLKWVYKLLNAATQFYSLWLYLQNTKFCKKYCRARADRAHRAASSFADFVLWRLEPSLWKHKQTAALYYFTWKTVFMSLIIVLLWRLQIVKNLLGATKDTIFSLVSLILCKGRLWRAMFWTAEGDTS